MLQSAGIAGVFVNIFSGRFFRFIAVGALNTLVDWGVLNIEIFAFGEHGGLFSYPVYKAVSFSVAVINSYLFNKRWVFKSSTADAHAMLPFALISLVGLGLNVLTASTVVASALCGGRFVLCANLGAIAGSWAAFLWNYIGYALFVFKR